MIDTGEKLEEYRDITPFYHARIDKYINAINRNEKVYVTFYKAYSTNRPCMTFEIDSIQQREGNLDWGAIPGNLYYCIKLGKRIN